MPLSDARAGKMASNITGFGRALRRAGVRMDSARIACAQQAALLVGLERRDDLSAALEAVMISREQDRMVFREMFEAYFQPPDLEDRLPTQMVPSAESRAEASRRRPRVREALSPPHPIGQVRPQGQDPKLDFDSAMTASARRRLQHADFNALGTAEYQMVERLARGIALPMPCMPTRRLQSGPRGARPHWPGVLRDAARSGGELLRLPLLARRRQPLPLLVLVDISGSMERYARLLLSFLHAATRQHRRRDVFAFGTGLTDLTPAFQCADADAMLACAGKAIADYAGGTRLGDSLAMLRQFHARRLVGRRSLVLLISDGLDTGEPEDLARELAWLKRRCRRLLWLNPLLRFDGYAPEARGAAVLSRQVDGMLAVHNLSRLEELAAALAAVMKR